MMRDQSQPPPTDGHLKQSPRGKGSQQQKSAPQEQQQQQQLAASTRAIANDNSWKKKQMTTITSTTKGTTMERSSTEVVKRQHDNNFRLVANLHALVKRFEEPNHHWARQLAILLVTILVLTTSLPNYQFYLEAEAKIHHSKRQAPANNINGAIGQQQQQQLANAGAGSSSLTGRESTNWWNVWWQRKFIPPPIKMNQQSDSLSAADFLLDTMDSSINEEANILLPNKPLQLRPNHLNPSTSLPSSFPELTEYINEAVQPTVRPIVAVSFNGQTINLSDQSNTVDLASPSNSIAQYQSGKSNNNNNNNNNIMGDVDTNLVLGNHQNHVNQFVPVDIERSERLINLKQPLAMAAEEQTAGSRLFGDTKQMLLAHAKTMQHQMHWQSVKPTIIQPSTTTAATTTTEAAASSSPTMLARDLRTNRQVANESPVSTGGETRSSSNLGIQMRAAMNTPTRQPISVGGKPNVRSQLSAGSAGFLASPAQKLFQQQQIIQRQQQQQLEQQQIILEDNGNKFEQQQNQMADYSEENEPDEDTEDANKTYSNEDGSSGGRTSTDSSSSSMMRDDKPNLIMPGMRKSIEPATATSSSGGQRQQMQAKQDTGRQQQQQPSGQGMMGASLGMEAQSVTPPPTTTTTSQQVQSTSRRLPATSATSMAPDDETNSARDEVAGRRMSADKGFKEVVQTSTRSPVPPTQASVATTTTTSPTITTTTTGSSGSTTTIKSSSPSDTNETPSATGGLPKTTTSGGRVQLENGRPATSFSRQQGTTNAARPPTLMSTQARNMVEQTISTTSAPTATTTTTMATMATMATIFTGSTAGATGSGSLGSSGDNSATKSNQFSVTPSTTTTAGSNQVRSTTTRPGTATGQTGQPSTTLPGAPTTPATTTTTTTTMVVSSSGADQTTTLAPTTTAAGPFRNKTSSSANSSSEAAGGSGDENDGEDDDEDGANEQPNGNAVNGTNLMNSSDEPNNDDEEEEEEEGDNNTTTTTTVAGQQQQQEQQTTTTLATPISISQQPTTVSQSAGAPLPMTTRQQQQQQQPGLVPLIPTTQQPSMTTTDIERLPKGPSTPMMGTTNLRGFSTVVQSTTPSSTMLSGSSISLAGTATTSGDIARIQQADGMQQQPQQQDNNANIIMMTMGQSRGPADEEMAITMPMEALMKMMDQVAQDSKDRQLQGSSAMPVHVAKESPLTTIANIPTTTTTTPLPTVPVAVVQESTTERPESMLATSKLSPTTIMRLDNDNAQDQSAMNSPVAPKRKLPQPLPPPTPRAGIRQQQQPIQMQTNFIENPSMSSGQMQNANSMTSAGPPDTQQDKMTTMMLNLENESVSPGEGEMMSISGGREPKIELLNLDLMPIQRIMGNRTPINNNNNNSPIDNQPTRNKNMEIERLTQQQQPGQQNEMRNQFGQFQQPQAGNSMFSNGTTSIAFGPDQPMEQVMIAEVEPGMRLRPPSGGSFMNLQQQQQQSGRGSNNPIIMSDMMSNKNQANTVYMIMMNSPSATQTTVGAPTQSAPTSKTSSSNGDDDDDDDDDNGGQTMTTMMMQTRDQTRTSSNQPTTKTIATTAMDRITRPSPVGSQSSSKREMQMRTTQPASFVAASSGTSAPSGTAAGGSPPPATGAGLFSTKSPFGTSTMQPQQQQKQMMMMMIQMSKQAASPATTTLASTTTTTSRPPSFMDNAVDLGGMQRQTNQPIGENDGSQRTTTRAQQQQQLASSPTPFSPGTMNAEQQATTTTTTTMAPERSTTATSRTSQPSTPKDDSMATTATILKGPTAATTRVAGFSRGQNNFRQGDSSNEAEENDNKNNGGGNKLQRLQVQPMTGAGVGGGDDKRQQMMQQQQQQQGITRTVPQLSKIGKSSNMTSASFIPKKLRNNFNRIMMPQQESQQQQQQQQQRARLTQLDATTQSPLTGMAIRQFGGANRMSVLGNQPVPFGRPAAMTMQSAAGDQSIGRQTTGGNRRPPPELPTFEYGPSIAVRRPDEPLANGQIPNCTLTGKNFCVLTKDYPMNEVRQAVERSFRSVRIMYEELQTVSDQELHKDDFNATNNQAASGKFACQTQVEMMRPGWAKDEITKEWMLVVNTDVFPQRVRTESCAQPNTPCEFIAPFYDSTCQQRYSLHRMIAIDPHDPSRSPQVAVFKFPAGCVCRVHPIKKTTTSSSASTATTSTPVTIISSSTSKSIRRRR